MDSWNIHKLYEFCFFYYLQTHHHHDHKYCTNPDVIGWSCPIVRLIFRMGLCFIKA